MSGQLGFARSLALIQDQDVAEGFIEHGLDQLARIDEANNFHQLPMHLLSNGIERLLKLTYAVGVLKSTSALPDPAELRNRLGHDLLKLNVALADLAETEPSYVRRPACAEDLGFMRTDALLQRVLAALTVYGSQGRYHNLSILLSDKLQPDPDAAWQEIEMAVLEASPWRERLGSPDFGQFYGHLAEVLTRTIQQYARAICRMWTLGPLGDLGHMHMPSQFLMIRDDDLHVLQRVHTRYR